MSDPLDTYFRRALKNWAADQQPPEKGRARLLLVAASPQRDQALLNPEKSARKPHIYTERDVIDQAPSDQAMQIYNLPWLWIAHMAMSPIRRVT